jgi:hypothetical protein
MNRDLAKPDYDPYISCSERNVDLSFYEVVYASITLDPIHTDTRSPFD